MGNEINLFGVGKRIRQSRESMKLSRDAFAERIPMSSSYLADIEGGTKCLSLEKFYRVVSELNVSADYILYGNGTDKSDEEQRKMIFEKLNYDLSSYKTEDLVHLANAVRLLLFIGNSDKNE